MASDNAPGGAITNVFYSLNGAAWTNATTPNGWINWTVDVVLTPQTNTIAAYAVDDDGNISATNTVTFVYIPSAPLTVLTNGNCTLSPNYDGALLELGAELFHDRNGGDGLCIHQLDCGNKFAIDSCSPTGQRCNLRWRRI